MALPFELVAQPIHGEILVAGLAAFVVDESWL